MQKVLLPCNYQCWLLKNNTKQISCLFFIFLLSSTFYLIFQNNSQTEIMVTDTIQDILEQPFKIFLPCYQTPTIQYSILIFLKKRHIFIIQDQLHGWVFMWVCVCECRYPSEAGGDRFPWNWSYKDCELPNIVQKTTEPWLCEYGQLNFRPISQVLSPYLDTLHSQVCFLLQRTESRNWKPPTPRFYHSTSPNPSTCFSLVLVCGI